MRKHSPFFILLFLSSLILLSLFPGCSGCLPTTPVTVTGTIYGYVAIPDDTVKDLTGYSPIPGATVTIVDAEGVTHTVITDEDGYYCFNNISVNVNTIINIEKETEDGGKLIFKDIVPLAVSQEEDYDAGIADAVSTATALVVEELVNLGQPQEEIDLDEITSSEGFDELKEEVQQAQEDNQDINTNSIDTQAEEIADNIANPQTPTPDPTPEPAPDPIPSPAPSPPTYNVTYDGNGSTGGSVPADANNYYYGATVTVLGNTGTLVKTQDGISLLFEGWNIAADGSGNGGTDYIAGDTFTMGSANVTLYAQWSVIRGTGPAGGLVFYDKGSISDGWRYLEAAPSDQSGSQAWSNISNVEIGASAQGVVVGKGQTNTTAIIGQTDHTGSAAKLCDDLSIVNNSITYSDWFLPSQDELHAMYTELHLIIPSDGGFAGYYYWSSSEDRASYAWGQYFYDGGQYNYVKNTTIRVRAVRAF